MTVGQFTTQNPEHPSAIGAIDVNGGLENASMPAKETTVTRCQPIVEVLKQRACEGRFRIKLSIFPLRNYPQ